MTKADEIYCSLLRDILENGVEKDTRAGRVKSVFGRQLRFDLKEGIPLLTTKKVYTKGVIHELLWFLQHPMNSHGSMNIEYLIRNGVHIWDDDAYRWFKTKIVNEIKPEQYMVCLDEDDKWMYNITRGRVNYEHWIESESKIKDKNWLSNITKEEFLDLTLQKVEIWQSCRFGLIYRFGDLGPVYGAQWRHFGDTAVDQIYNVVKTLKENPNDRRMLCVAWNPAKLESMALPPCHVMFQFYTRELGDDERVKMFGEINEDTPKYGLSCMYTMRSNDVGLGWSFNVLMYSILTHMIAKLVNMVPDELVASLGDCHIYTNHIKPLEIQMARKGSDITPRLVIHGNQINIGDFKYNNFEIVDYYPDSAIKMPLSVGKC